MEENVSSNAINKWLKLPENQKRLSRIARSIDEEFKDSRNLKVLIGPNYDLYEPPEVIRGIIESELVVFLIEKKHIFEKLIQSGDPNFSRYLKTSFKNHCIDKARSKSQDPRKYLYKRLSDILRESEGFHTNAGKKDYMAFSRYPENQRVAPPTLEDIRQISFPTHLVASLDYESVNRKAVLLELSEYFWLAVSQMQDGKAIWVTVWSVIEWIESHIWLTAADETKGVPKPAVKRFSDGNPDQTGQQTVLDGIPDDKHRPDADQFDPHLIKKWAGCFAEQLNQKEKSICYSGWALQLGLEEIAQKLGYKGASGPQYLLKQMEDKLRKFLRPLDWLDPDDLNEEAFDLFNDTLFSILKKSVSES